MLSSSLARPASTTKAERIVDRPRAASSRPPAVDFDLHGMVGIRLLDATAADRATIVRQLGPIAATLHREPDIVIRFVDRLTPQSPMRILSVGEAGYSDDAFFILRSMRLHFKLFQ